MEPMRFARSVLLLCALGGCSRGEAHASGRARTRARPTAHVPAAALAPALVPAPAPATTNARVLTDRTPALVTPPAPELAGPRPARTELLRLASAPHAAHPEVLVHTPAGYDPAGPLRVVLFLHGWYGCVSVVAGDRDGPCHRGGRSRHSIDVVSAFDRAGVNAVLVLPQLAYERASSDAGRLNEPGGLRRMLDEVRAQPAVLEMLGPAQRPASAFIVAGHSGAHAPIARVLEAGDVSPRCVLFFDALFRVPPALARWARARPERYDPTASGVEAPTRFSFAYTTSTGTGFNTLRFVRSLAELLPAEARPRALALHSGDGTPDESVYAHPLVAVRTRVSHEDVPRVFLPPMLRACVAALPGNAPEGDPRSPAL